MELAEAAQRLQERANRRQRELYAYARQLGFKASEAMVLSRRSKRRIDEEAERRRTAQ